MELELRDKDHKVLDTVRAGGWFKLPNGDHISPAKENWKNKEGFYLIRVEPKMAPPPPKPTIADRRRNSRPLSRAEFCIAIYRVGLLTASEAINAAKGDVPAPLEQAIRDLPEQERVEAAILWAGLTQVERAHPMVDLLRVHVGMTDEQVDEMFGVNENVEGLV